MLTLFATLDFVIDQISQWMEGPATRGEVVFIVVVALALFAALSWLASRG